MRYPDHLKEDIRSRVDIVELISRYVPLKKSGSGFKGLCPFHQEKTPSFTVTPGKNIFHCFGCGKGGDAFAFLMEIEHLGFVEAYQVLAKEAGIDLSRYEKDGVKEEDPIFRANRFAQDYFYKCLCANKPAHAYLIKRGLTDETIEQFKIGFAPDAWDYLIKAAAREKISMADLQQAGLVTMNEEKKSSYDRFRCRIMFPICNLSGLVVGFGGRTLKKNEKGAKYINTPETRVYHKGSVLYGLHAARGAIREADAGIVVEGYMDFHGLVQAGIRNVVASSGTALTPEQAKMLRRYCRKVFLVFDPDPAGINAASRGMEVLAREGLEIGVVSLPEGDDPDTFVKQNGPDAFGALLEKAESFIDFRLRLAIAQHGLEKPESKDRIMAEMAECLLAVQSEALRESYAQRIESQLRLSSAATRSVLQQARRKKTRSTGQDSRAPRSGAKQTYMAELQVLGHLITEPGLLEKAAVLDEHPDIWSHPFLDSFYGKLRKSIGAGCTDFLASGGEFEPKEQEFLRRVLAEKDQYAAANWEPSVTRLFLRYYIRKESEIRSRMAQKGVDRTALVKEADALARKRKEIEKRARIEIVEKNGKSN